MFPRIGLFHPPRIPTHLIDLLTLIPTYYPLRVFITKRSIAGVQEISNGVGSSKFLQSDGVIQLELRAGRVVEHSSRSADAVLPIREVSVLPHGPDPIELGVVQVEYRIAVGGEGVPHVSTDAFMGGKLQHVCIWKRKAKVHLPRCPAPCTFVMFGLSPSSIVCVKSLMLGLCSRSSTLAAVNAGAIRLGLRSRRKQCGL